LRESSRFLERGAVDNWPLVNLSPRNTTITRDYTRNPAKAAR
jgi:hypothetical protein